MPVLFCIEPAPALRHISNEGHAELEPFADLRGFTKLAFHGRSHHAVMQQHGHPVLLFRGAVDNELVVDLENELCAEAVLL